MSNSGGRPAGLLRCGFPAVQPTLQLISASALELHLGLEHVLMASVPRAAAASQDPRTNYTCPALVQDLKYATLATVSRCGMVWFSEDVLSTEMIFENYMFRLRHIPLEETDEDSGFGKKAEKDDVLSPALQDCNLFPKKDWMYVSKTQPIRWPPILWTRQVKVPGAHVW
ncbi:hypothetical protein PR048_030281 [Dryococelus australis]|uniref:Uncharacterized protein n=1 Tax=Dryococelus australis TaxID=614101 RepID=A0ABQ9GCF5_9NEOP|nr:hypothetical protein PR048_030281 [Dryococelus australis]